MRDDIELPAMDSPTLAAAVVLRDGEGRVLLVRQAYGHERWSVPGGVVEPGESPAEAALREVTEETGLTVELGQLVGVYYLRSARPGLRFIFSGRVTGGVLRLPSDGEIAAQRWFPPDDLPQPTTPTAPFAVGDAVAERRGRYREIDSRSG